MSWSLALLGDAELEVALRDLAGALATPRPSLDLARAARLRIETTSARRRWPGRIPGRPVRRGLVLALAALLLLAGLAAALGLGLPGLRILFVETTHSPSPSLSPGSGTSVVEALHLGRPVDPASIDEEVGFHVRMPDDPGLGAPLGAVIELAPGVWQASLVYMATPDFPATSGRSVAILITELPASLDESLVAKFIRPATTVEIVTVDGLPGYWIAGGLHEIGYLDRHGQVVVDSVRLAGNVLAWNAGGITYRIEGAEDLASAEAIAASMR